MNERIQELITTYLHRGSTPEQERELFEACKNDPSAAEHLRQHLILSLKLRGLRDSVEVDEDLHRAVARRIEGLEAAPAPVPAESRVQAERPSHAPARRFGFLHVFGAAAATAAAAVVLTLTFLPDANELPSPTATIAVVSDTVYVVERDTVRQVHEVTRPVYIVRTEKPPANEARASETPSMTDDDRADRTPAGEAVHTDAPAMADAGRNDDRHGAETGDNGTAAPIDVPVAENPAGGKTGNALLADARPVQPATREERKKSYLEQYNAMLVSVASVKLTDNDRITY